MTFALGKAQKTAAYFDKDAQYKLGIDLFDKKLYTNAQKEFNEYIQKNKNGIQKTDAVFYAAACGIELFNKDGEWLMRQFIEKNPESLKINSAWFYLGKSSFRRKKYKETIENMEKVDIYSVDKDQLAELYFKRGYSYMVLDNNSKAKVDFAEIKDVDNKYQHPALYYFSHLAYEEKNYEIALVGFKKLIGNQTFGTVVPYYITQIYFSEGKFEQVVAEGPDLLRDSNHVQRSRDINRMIGESHFNLKNYSAALPFLKKTDLGYSPTGNYAIGYCYYKTGDYKNAVRHLYEATEKNDSLSQNAWYHMADCYIQLKDKIKAKNAYYKAYQNNYNHLITEDALFSYAKLSYELDFSPYNDAVRSFSRYLKEYPGSPRKNECYNYLINVYSTTRNYSQAIKSIESMDKVDPILNVTYQKLIYFNGVEYFNNGDLNNAEKEFKKSLQHKADLKFSALSQYWLGEISYLRKDYSTAIESWKTFQLMEGAVQLKEYELSNYALGYAYFLRKNKDDYTNAHVSFRKFLMTNNTLDEKKVNDAHTRIADSYFMNTDYFQASDYYKKTIDAGKVDVDYALFQKGLCDGLQRKYESKITELKKIETGFPASHYLSAALNEIADTYLQNLKENENAILYYNKILKNYPNSSFTRNCYAQLGNIYYAKKEDDQAFEYFDKFVKLDAKSDEAKEILETIKKIFTEKGQIDEMEKYFANMGNPLSENQIEKAAYASAYDAFYNQKNCDLALPKWESYIQRFPNGKYITEAHFVVAECNYGKNNYESALNGYLHVINKPRGLYSEVALSKASYIYNKDKNYKEALPLFIQLQEVAETPSNKSAGKFGAMRAAFYLNEYETALTECTKVLNTEKLTPQQNSEAVYIKARSLYETNRLDDAAMEFKSIVKTAKNLKGAESYYYLAKISYSKQDYKDVVKQVNKLIGYEYTNDEWNNKAMLLLADAYMANNEFADAQVVLESIIEGKVKQEYVDEANKKLEELKAKTRKNEEPLENKSMNIEFEQSQKDKDVQNQVIPPTNVVPENTNPEEPK
ncbi:MAG: tetratricopeptide repeat protein [Sphingobacteriaceae bacterium]|nr:tetratricopeptide repeat protein [Sphingobacteriaceae bacterium]